MIPIKAIQLIPHIIESSDCILNMLLRMYLSMILFNTSYGIYSIPKELKYKAVFYK